MKRLAFIIFLVPAALGQEDPQPQPEKPEIVALRHQMDLLYQEVVVAGVALERTAGYLALDPKDPELLERMHYVLMKLSSSESQKIMASRILTAWGLKESVYPLLLTMNDPAEDERVRAEIIESIGRFGDDRAIIPVTNVLKGKDDRLHPGAARSLSAFGGNERTQRYFKSLIYDENPSTRGWAARSIGWSGWEEGGAILLAASRTETDPTALGRILLALADLGVVEGVGPAVEGLGHPEEIARVLAAEALGIFGPRALEAGLEPLLRRVEDPRESVGVRGTAAGQIPLVAPESDEAARRLTALMGSQPSEFDLAIKVALRYMASRQLVEDLIRIMGDKRETESRRRGAWQVLRAMSGRDMPEDPVAWATWWSEQGSRFDFPNSKKRAGR